MTKNGDLDKLIPTVLLNWMGGEKRHEKPTVEVEIRRALAGQKDAGRLNSGKFLSFPGAVIRHIKMVRYCGLQSFRSTLPGGAMSPKAVKLKLGGLWMNFETFFVGMD